MNLLSIVRPRNSLILIKKAQVYRSQMMALQIVGVAALLVLIGYVLAARIQRGYLAVAGIPLVIILGLALRAYDIRRYARRDESVCFDKEHDAILRNGESLAAIS